jgi:hypothetical protein
LPAASSWESEVGLVLAELGLADEFRTRVGSISSTESGDGLRRIIEQLKVRLRGGATETSTNAQELEVSNLPNSVEFAEQLPDVAVASTNDSPDGRTCRIVPEWIGVRDDRWIGELRFEGQLIRQLQSRANNQIKILDAFQKADWSSSVSNLFVGNSSDGRQTVTDLNKKLKTIKFSFRQNCTHWARR